MGNKLRFYIRLCGREKAFIFNQIHFVRKITITGYDHDNPRECLQRWKKQDYDHIYPNSYMQIHDFMTTPIHIYKWKYVISWLQMSKFIKANIKTIWISLKVEQCGLCNGQSLQQGWRWNKYESLMQTYIYKYIMQIQM